MKLFALLLAVTISLVTLINMKSGQLSEINRISPSKSQIEVTDYLGRQVTIPYPVTRAAIINPYCAELVTAAGAGSSICGVDKDIYENRAAFPFPITKDMIIGGHGEQQLDYEKLIAMRPEILILDSGFYYRRAEQILSPFGIKILVIHTDSANLFSHNCDLLGKIFHTEPQAERLKNYFEGQWNYVRNQLKDEPKKRVYYECRREGRSIIPGEPFNELLDVAHAENVFNDANSIWVSNEYTIMRNPDYIVRLSDSNEDYSYYPPSENHFRQIHEDIRNRKCWSYINAVKEDNIFLFSYYSHGGAGKIVGGLYLAKYLYPELLPDLHPEDAFKTWLEEYEGVSYLPGHTYPSYHLVAGDTHEP